MKTKKILLISIILIAFISIDMLVSIIFLKNIDSISKIFVTNNLLQEFLTNLTDAHIVLPVEVILFFSLLCVVICIFSYNKKIVLFILISILLIIFIITTCLLSKYDGIYTYQIIKNLMEIAHEK